MFNDTCANPTIGNFIGSVELNEGYLTIPVHISFFSLCSSLFSALWLPASSELRFLQIQQLLHTCHIELMILTEAPNANYYGDVRGSKRLRSTNKFPVTKLRGNSNSEAFLS